MKIAEKRAVERDAEEYANERMAWMLEPAGLFKASTFEIIKRHLAGFVINRERRRASAGRRTKKGAKGS